MKIIDNNDLREIKKNLKMLAEANKFIFEHRDEITLIIDLIDNHIAPIVNKLEEMGVPRTISWKIVTMEPQIWQPITKRYLYELQNPTIHTTPPNTCYMCGFAEFWTNPSGLKTCAICHPKPKEHRS